MTDCFRVLSSFINTSLLRQTKLCFLSYALAAIAVVAATAEPAQACTFGLETFYLTTTIPRQLPANSLVADVEVLSVKRPSLSRFVITAKVRSAIAGDPSIKEIVIDKDRVTSCDQIPRVGDHGIVAGTVRSFVDSVATTEPVRSPGIWSDDAFPPRTQLGVGHIVERRHP